MYNMRLISTLQQLKSIKVQKYQKTFFNLNHLAQVTMLLIQTSPGSNITCSLFCLVSKISIYLKFTKYRNTSWLILKTDSFNSFDQDSPELLITLITNV